MKPTDTALGSVVALWRYPVKSMQGEELNSAFLTERGLLGDRAYALLDRATGHIASAKHPGKWSRLFQCRAAYVEPPRPEAPLPPVWITLPDGTVIRSDQADVDTILSRVLERNVTLLSRAPDTPTREADRTPPDGSSGQVINQEPMALAAPPGTFFDYAPVHLLTTATLDRFREIYARGQFETRRFRPNLVIRPTATEPGFVENNWLGYTLAVGTEQATLHAVDPCPRCVVTTLAQGDLPADPGILRTIAQHNSAASATLAPGVVFPAIAGIYARTLQPGMICRDDTIRLQET